MEIKLLDISEAKQSTDRQTDVHKILEINGANDRGYFVLDIVFEDNIANFLHECDDEVFEKSGAAYINSLKQVIDKMRKNRTILKHTSKGI